MTESAVGVRSSREHGYQNNLTTAEKKSNFHLSMQSEQWIVK